MTTFSYQIRIKVKKHKENQNLFILFNKHTKKKVVLQMRDRNETFVE